MSFWRRLVSIGIVTVTIITFAAGSTRSFEIDEVMNKALKDAGIIRQLEMLPETVISCIPDDWFSSKKSRHEIVSFLKEKAGKDTLLSQMRIAVRPNVDFEKLQQVLRFYDSNLGKKVGHLQETALDPEIMKDLRAKRAVLAVLHEARMNTLDQIVTVTRMADAHSNLLNSIIEGLVKGYSDETPSADHLANETNKQIRTAIKEAIADSNRSREFALICLASGLRTLDDRELKELAIFYSSDAGIWFNNWVQKGLELAVNETGRNLGIALARWRLHSVKATDEKGS